MGFFEILSVISFCLSTYLTLSKIYNSLVRMDIDILSAYKNPEIVFVKVSINNKSTNPVAITKAALVNQENSISALATHYDRKIFSVSFKSNNEITGSNNIVASKIPINVPMKSATSFYLAFPASKDEINQLCTGKIRLEVKANGRKIYEEFDFNSKSFPREQLKKEARQL